MALYTVDWLEVDKVSELHTVLKSDETFFHAIDVDKIRCAQRLYRTQYGMVICLLYYFTTIDLTSL